MLAAKPGAPHWARIKTANGRDEALSVKSTGCDAFGLVNIAVTGVVVPNGNAGMLTFAFDELTSVMLCRPPLVSAMLTVTEPGPAVIASNTPELPGNASVTVSVGVQGPPGVGVGVGVGGTGVGVGVGGTGVGVGVGGIGVGVGVGGTGVGVGVGDGPGVHWALTRMAFIREEARNVKSTGCPGFGIVKVAVTGSNVPDGNDGMLTLALDELTRV